jgi:hypothetical protein
VINVGNSCRYGDVDKINLKVIKLKINKNIGCLLSFSTHHNFFIYIIYYIRTIIFLNFKKNIKSMKIILAILLNPIKWFDLETC